MQYKNLHFNNPEMSRFVKVDIYGVSMIHRIYMCLNCVCIWRLSKWSVHLGQVLRWSPKHACPFPLVQPGKIYVT